MIARAGAGALDGLASTQPVSNVNKLPHVAPGDAFRVCVEVASRSTSENAETTINRRSPRVA